MVLFYWLVTFVTAIGLAVWANRFYDRPIDTVQSWVLAFTAVTFAAFAIDKRIAIINERRKKHRKDTFTRFPEELLLALTFAGGTVGALFGIFFVDHKTVKFKFQIKFWLTIILQFLFLAAYVNIF